MACTGAAGKERPVRSSPQANQREILTAAAGQAPPGKCKYRLAQRRMVGLNGKPSGQLRTVSDPCTRGAVYSSLKTCADLP
jgi:hypothetical protein